MAFFGIAAPKRGAGRTPTPRAGTPSIEFLHKHECVACPLNNQQGLRHPHMAPTGAERPLAYLIGEAPGADEDRTGEQFVGLAGRILRRRLPGRWLKQVRFNNAVRTRPPKNRDPSRVEVEACRPSIVRDIEASRPAAIVGFGNVPLEWATGEVGITRWCGRRVPVLVGGRPYWYFPVLHPSAIQRDPKWRGLQRDPARYGSEVEFQFALHVRRALEAIEAGLPDPVVHSPEDAVAGVEWVTGAGGEADLERVAKFLVRAAERKVAGIDYETNAIRPYEDGAKILSAAVSTVDGTLAFPFDHREAKWTKQQRSVLAELWLEFLYAPGVLKVVHKLDFEMEWSAFFYGKDCLWGSRWGCSLSQAFVLDERPKAHSLEFLGVQYFGINLKALAKDLNRAALDADPLPRVLQYNGVDAKYHRLLFLEQAKALSAAGLAALYREHVERLPAAVLTQMRGIPINQDAVVDMGEKYAGRMREAEDRLRALPEVRAWERSRGGTKFRPSANEDVAAVLHSMGVHLDSVDEDALDTVDHEIARLEIEYRKAAKVFGTYVLPVANSETRDALGVDQTDPKLRPSRIYPDGLGHPLTNMNRTRTSRSSAEEWNYQNWPKRGEYGAKEVRVMVEPVEPDELVVSFDYGQIQFRNIGMESLDPNLIKALWDDYDIHTDYAEAVARLYPRWIKEGVKALASDKSVMKVYRNRAKNEYVFPSCFGAQPKSKAESLGVPVWVTEKLDDVFWGRFNKIKHWHDRVEANYYKTGYITGLSGYRRWAPVGYNERINTPIQGDEAKIVLDAMVRLSKIDHDWLQANMEIHDDLTFVWPKKRVDELADIVIKAMLEVPFKWARCVPIVVEMEVGRNWAEMHAPKDAGFNRLAAGKFASHQYAGINMPKECQL